MHVPMQFRYLMNRQYDAPCCDYLSLYYSRPVSIKICLLSTISVEEHFARFRSQNAMCAISIEHTSANFPKCRWRMGFKHRFIQVPTYRAPIEVKTQSKKAKLNRLTCCDVTCQFFLSINETDERVECRRIRDNEITDDVPNASPWLLIDSSRWRHSTRKTQMSPKHPCAIHVQLLSECLFCLSHSTHSSSSTEVSTQLNLCPSDAAGPLLQE